jgi:peptide-methionine (S)-S-oxide reductase
MTKLIKLYDAAMARVFDKLQSPLLLILRLFIGWQFFITGKGKLENLDKVVHFFTSLGIPAPELNARFVATLETVGGLLLIVGLFSRLIAIPLVINMLVAYATADRDALVNVFHDADGFTHAEPFLFLLIPAIVLAFGPGVFSLDYLLKRWRLSAQARRTAVAAGALLLMAAATPAPAPQAAVPQHAVATFAGGCFWCMEPPFERMKGVISVTSGYTGGTKVNPTYEEVSDGFTGHRESVEVVYDPRQVSFGQLLDVFWHNIDPTDNSGQFCDHGSQYRSAIFYHDAEQQRLAETSRHNVAAQLKQRIVTDVLPAARFYRAEECHQDYYKKNPVRYKFYRFNCGRDHRLEQVWGKAPDH